MSQQGGPEQGSRRYPRTFRALIASMIVLVVIVVAFWAVTTSFSDAVREERGKDVSTEIEWADDVRAVQSAAESGDLDFEVVYPAEPPEGWYANTEPRFEVGDDPSWQLGFVDGEEGYVGIQQSSESAFALVERQVDEEAEKGEQVELDSGLGGDAPDTWTSWTDDGGDHAFTAEFDGMTLIVWGPDEDDVRTFVGELTTAPLK